MPTLKIELNQRQYETLLAIAIREWRPTVWQAERMMRDAIEREASPSGLVQTSTAGNEVEHCVQQVLE